MSWHIKEVNIEHILLMVSVWSFHKEIKQNCNFFPRLCSVEIVGLHLVILYTMNEQIKKLDYEYI